MGAGPPCLLLCFPALASLHSSDLCISPAPSSFRLHLPLGPSFCLRNNYLHCQQHEALHVDYKIPTRTPHVPSSSLGTTGNHVGYFGSRVAVVDGQIHSVPDGHPPTPKCSALHPEMHVTHDNLELPIPKLNEAKPVARYGWSSGSCSRRSEGDKFPSPTPFSADLIPLPLPIDSRYQLYCIHMYIICMFLCTYRDIHIYIYISICVIYIYIYGVQIAAMRPEPGLNAPLPVLARGPGVRTISEDGRCYLGVRGSHR